MKMWILLAAVTCCTLMVVTIPASAIDIVLTFDPLAPEAGVNNWSEGNFQDAGVQVGGQLQLRRRRKP